MRCIRTLRAREKANYGLCVRSLLTIFCDNISHLTTKLSVALFEYPNLLSGDVSYAAIQHYSSSSLLSSLLLSGAIV
jgi:hypothetical protein